MFLLLGLEFPELPSWLGRLRQYKQCSFGIGFAGLRWFCTAINNPWETGVLEDGRCHYRALDLAAGCPGMTLPE